MAKTHPLCKLARLKGRKWMKQDAEEYFYTRLMGHDGEDAWSLEDAAARVSRKIKIKVSPSRVSAWRKRRSRDIQLRADYEALREHTFDFIADFKDLDLSLDDVVDVQLLNMIAKVHKEEGVEDAIRFVNALTGLKKALTADGLLKQRAVEHTESTEKLKETIARQHAELKKHGLSEDVINELNRRTVEEIDSMVAANSKK